MRWWQRASRATHWQRHEWRVLGEAWQDLFWARLALRRWPLPELLARLDAGGQRGTRGDDPARLVRAVQRAAHLFPLPMLCLPQSLALARLLARRGMPCEVLIGARPRSGALDAHAWVELAGEPLNSPPDSATTHPILLRRAIGSAP